MMRRRRRCNRHRWRRKKQLRGERRWLQGLDARDCAAVDPQGPAWRAGQRWCRRWTRAQRRLWTEQKATGAGQGSRVGSAPVPPGGLGPEAVVGAEFVASWIKIIKQENQLLCFSVLTEQHTFRCLTHLCWCNTSSNMLRCSDRAGPREPLLPRLQGVGAATCRVRPLILFSPRNPLVRVFFLSCWRKALRPVGRETEGSKNKENVKCGYAITLWSIVTYHTRRTNKTSESRCCRTLSEGGV